MLGDHSDCTFASDLNISTFFAVITQTENRKKETKKEKKEKDNTVLSFYNC